MEAYKQEFIEFMVDCGVLKFGDFVTKSGRKTPFFINTGFYRTGAQLNKLGEYYAKAINDKFVKQMSVSEALNQLCLDDEGIVKAITKDLNRVRNNNEKKT